MPCRTPSSRRDGAVFLACIPFIVAWQSTVHVARSMVWTTRDSLPLASFLPLPASLPIATVPRLFSRDTLRTRKSART
ncbi:hypothetical protein EDD16DRAFT_72802 [Pisolithus croceorrhizus]|nr:hypothetical protein EDD16DRAFT_72802 [Pisolithus croceorrhizus]KAI6162902.1 hypothetical protein EDD17DRAFT_531837 [Pisolithus thermaeus]